LAHALVGTLEALVNPKTRTATLPAAASGNITLEPARLSPSILGIGATLCASDEVSNPRQHRKRSSIGQFFPEVRIVITSTLFAIACHLDGSDNRLSSFERLWIWVFSPRFICSRW
jgi:hypothetical protein